MYIVHIKKSALQELAKIMRPFNQKIVDAIDKLAVNPRPIGAKKLQGAEAYRIRVADYRIVYTIEDVIKIVEVQRIRHRKDAYR